MSQKTKPVSEYFLPEKTEIRTLDELNGMMVYMIEVENYEMCSKIKKLIDNYDVLVNKLKTNND